MAPFFRCVLVGLSCACVHDALPAAADEPSATRPAASSASPTAREPITTVAEGTTRAATKASITFSGYVEALYQWNFNAPSNGITNFRAFDARHNTFTISNAVLDALGTLGPVSAHVALQVGLTAEIEYASEPNVRGSSSVPPLGAPAWKLLQQANVGWRAPLGRGLLAEAGLFLSPIGPEGMAVKAHWTWSRSTLFASLPFYHTGVRLTYPFTDRITASLQVYNGWNSLIDNNPEKSVAAQLTYNVPDRLTVNFIYFTGVERPENAPEGRPWRHLFDAYGAWYPRPWLSLLAHTDAGFEPNAFGTSWWAAGALYARVHPWSWFYGAVRGDFFYQHQGQGAGGTASPIFWPARWLTEVTVTADFRPVENLSLRVEYRHDHAQAPLFFEDTVPVQIQTGAFVPNAEAQNTLTVGAIAWF